MAQASGPDRPAPIRARRPETSQTLDRGLAVLELLEGSSGGMSVTELADRLGVARPIVYRLLSTLEQHGLVRRPLDGRVRLGLGLFALAQRLQPLLREAAIPVLRRLAEDVGATAHLTVVDGGEALAVAVVEPSWTDVHVAYRVGSRHPLSRGAAGRAILAARARGSSGSYAPDDAPRVPAAGARAERPTPGFVSSTGELQPGAHGVAAVLDGVPAVEASLGVIALSDLDHEVVGPLVVAAAADVAAALR